LNSLWLVPRDAVPFDMNLFVSPQVRADGNFEVGVGGGGGLAISSHGTLFQGGHEVVLPITTYKYVLQSKHASKKRIRNLKKKTK